MRDKALRDAFATALGDMVSFDVPLASRVAYRIGGPADIFVKPLSSEALAATLRIVHEHGAPVTVLGTGSNVLVSDLGIRGVTIRLAGELADIHLGLVGTDEGELEIGAGALNAPLVALALAANLVGIEFLGTIPGTFGGALIMNAGAHGGEIAGFVQDVTVVTAKGEVETRAGADCGFAYRSSGFGPSEILTQARLRAPRGDASAARGHLAQMRQARRASQPIGEPNAGSIFKNPPGDYAGRLIEACGFKGKNRGGAMVSPKHANFIVNTKGALAADVVALADEVATAVRDRFGVELQWEVRRIGEWK